MNVPELIVHVIRIVDKPPVVRDPASSSPAVIVRARTVPIPIPVEPRPNRETASKGKQSGSVAVGISPEDVWIVLWNVNIAGLRRFDSDNIRSHDDLLFRIALQNAFLYGSFAQTLNRCLNVAPLRDIRLPNSRCPIRVLGHEPENARIMSNCFDADVPGLAFDQALVNAAIQQSLSSCYLIAKARSGQDLRQQWIRIECNSRQHLVEFISAECCWLEISLWCTENRQSWWECECYSQNNGQVLKPRSCHLCLPRRT